MIGKVPKPGRGFQGLVSYLLRGGLKERDGAGRVAWTATRNLLVDDPETAPKLMRLTAARSVRVQRPVYHLVISWHENERPTADAMRAVADATCRDLGLDEHQRLYIAHRDRRHPHVHIVVNRVHPETGLAWQTSHDFRRIERSLARQAGEMGLAVVPGRHNGKLRDRSGSRRPRDGELRKARRDGAPARGRWSAERIAKLRPLLRPLFETAASWTELERALAAHGLSLAAKGQGIVITDGTAEMKLSDLGAGIRRTGLEARFGEAWAKHSAALAPETERAQRRRRRREAGR